MTDGCEICYRDHGFQCLLPARHEPADRHETEHERMCCDLRRGTPDRIQDTAIPTLAAKVVALQHEVSELRGRLRETAQCLIAAVGAMGPEDAVDTAKRAVHEIRDAHAWRDYWRHRAKSAEAASAAELKKDSD